MAGRSRLNRPIILWDDAVIYWVAGIIEGEGSIHQNKTHKGGYLYPRIRVNMTDQDIIQRLFDITGIGTITGPQKAPSRKEHWKENYVWAVSRKEEVFRLLGAIYPILGQRKQAQVERCI